MRSANHFRTRGLLAALLAAASFAGVPVFAQDDQTDPEDVLRGPEVDDTEVPGAPGTFGEYEMRPKQGAERPIPMRMFLEALRTLDGPEAPADLALTDAQAESIRGIAGEFREARRAFMREHAEEIRALRGRQGPRGERGNRRGLDERGPEGQRRERARPLDEGRRRSPAPGERGQPTPEQREQLRALMAQGPQPADYQARIFETLDEAQQDHMTATLDEMREKLIAERERRRMERDRDRASDGDGRGRTDDRGPAERGGGASLGPRGDRDLGALRARLDRLPPEARRRVIDRLRAELDFMLASAPPPPPPPIDALDIPPAR